MAGPRPVLTLVSDLFFAVHIEGVLTNLGFEIRRIEHGDDLEPGMASPTFETPAAQPGEPLVGRGSVFVARVADWRPALIIVQLTSSSIPWAPWIAALKSSPATRRTPVLAFGPHVDAELMARAADVGCDTVVAQGHLMKSLPQLIGAHARTEDADALEADCQGDISPRALHGIELFNRGEYFEAHEELELAWMEEPAPGRELYRGILQVAVAYLQITRGNYRGALKMFLRMRQWLDPLPAACRGIRVAQLRNHALAARTALEALGPDRIAEFDTALLLPVELVRQPN